MAYQIVGNRLWRLFKKSFYLLKHLHFSKAHQQLSQKCILTRWSIRCRNTTVTIRREDNYKEHKISPNVTWLKWATLKDYQHAWTFFFVISPMIWHHKRNPHNDIRFRVKSASGKALHSGNCRPLSEWFWVGKKKRHKVTKEPVFPKSILKIKYPKEKKTSHTNKIHITVLREETSLLTFLSHWYTSCKPYMDIIIGGLIHVVRMAWKQ